MAYQIKISIMEIEPAIWRRLKIPGNITFQQLHQIIQAAFGWLDSHLYKFQFDKTIITTPDDDYAPGELYGEDKIELDSENTKINKFFDAYDNCEYDYDFGDSWYHKIIIEKRLKDTKRNNIPECTGGARFRPPEDVGGTGGYEDFIKIIKNKKNPERDEYLGWAEKDTRGFIYDPDYFNINEVNRRLYYALENDAETAELMLTGQGLTGKVVWGWSDTCIEVDGKRYSMEQIGNMLLRIGVESIVTIKVNPTNKRY